MADAKLKEIEDKQTNSVLVTSDSDSNLLKHGR